MSLHHDLAWWGVTLSIVALVLMVPAAILANVVTPKIQNWWASRSRASLVKRIDKLERRRDGWEHFELITPTEEIVLNSIQILLACVIPGVFGIGYVAISSLFEHSKDPAIIIILFVLLLAAFLAMWGAQQITQYREPRSSRSRDYLKRELEMLKLVLAKKTARQTD